MVWMWRKKKESNKGFRGPGGNINVGSKESSNIFSAQHTEIQLLSKLWKCLSSELPVSRNKGLFFPSAEVKVALSQIHPTLSRNRPIQLCYHEKLMLSVQPEEIATINKAALSFQEEIQQSVCIQKCADFFALLCISFLMLVLFAQHTHS